MSRVFPENLRTRSKPRLGFCMASSGMSEKSSKPSAAVEYPPIAWSSRKRSVLWARRGPGARPAAKKTAAKSVLVIVLARHARERPTPDRAAQTSNVMRPRKMTMPLREKVSRTSQSPGMTTLTGNR